MKEISLTKENENNKEALKELEHIKNKGKYIVSLGIINVLLSFFLALVLVIYVFPGKFVLIKDDSMSPKLKVNEIVYSFPKELTEVQIGNVISFYGDSDDMIVHRVVEKFDSKGDVFLRTRGDNNPIIDNEVIDKDNYIGEVKAILPAWLGKILFKDNSGTLDSYSYSIFFGTVIFMLIVLDVLILLKKMK